MDFKFKITVGTTEIEITEKADNHKQFIEKLSFFSSLPSKGPNGADDLKFVARKTSKGDTYYSLISEKDKAEFKLGQHKNKEESLYPKGWEDLFGAVNYGDENQTAQQEQPVQATAPAKVATPTISRPNIPTSKPVVAPTPEQMTQIVEATEPAVEAAPAQAAPVAAAPQAAKPVLPGIKRPIIPGGVKAPTPSAPAAAAPVTTAPTTAPGKPVVSSNVNSVLAKYGIQKQ